MKISYIVLAIILLLGVIITGCNTDSIDAPAQDTDSVEDALVSPSYSTTLDNMLKEFRSSELTGAQAKDGDTVQVHYTGKLTDGTVFDSSVQREPLEFKLGAGQMIPGFEKAVLGMKVGERKTVTIPAEEAYGPRNNNLVWEIALTQLPSGLNPQVGQALQLRQSDNSTVRVIVTAVSDNSITVDGNRPLAGKDLTFEIELVKIQ